MSQAEGWGDSISISQGELVSVTFAGGVEAMRWGAVSELSMLYYILLCWVVCWVALGCVCWVVCVGLCVLGCVCWVALGCVRWAAEGSGGGRVRGEGAKGGSGGRERGEGECCRTALNIQSHAPCVSHAPPNSSHAHKEGTGPLPTLHAPDARDPALEAMRTNPVRTNPDP